MTNKEVAKTGTAYVMNTYKRYELCLVEGSGCYVRDVEGKTYLDFIGGIAVMSLGHGNKKVMDAIKSQCDRLMQCSNLFWIEPQVRLAKLLVDHSFADKAFFCNSGAEANEAAIKLARKYSSEKYGAERYNIITMKNSFHGRTMATLTATGQEKVQKGFYPLLQGFHYVPFNDSEALEAAVNAQTCAILLEPVQGEGGVTSVSPEYLAKAKELCTKNDVLLIYDEIQCGLGRTGKLFAYQHYDIEPDIMTLSKSLGGGIPIGCCLARADVAKAFKPGDHGSTFGGSPLASAAGYATVSTLLEDGILDHAAEMGSYLYDGLQKLKAKYAVVKDVRGKGLLLGMEITVEAAALIQSCHDKGLLVCGAGANVIRFVPPLIVERKDIDLAIGILDDVLGGV